MYAKTKVNNQHRKNRITIVVIFALAVVPFLIAWFFASNPDLVKLGSSNGELIRPPLTTIKTDFKGYDAFSTDNLKEIPGHWLLINVLPEDECLEKCKEALYKTQQISLMMGKDISRLRRAALIIKSSEQSQDNVQWPEDPYLLKIVLQNNLQEKIQAIISTPIPDGMLLIMDPLGNLMMKYSSGYDPYKVKSDLSKLLKISQIG